MIVSKRRCACLFFIADQRPHFRVWNVKGLLNVIPERQAPVPLPAFYAGIRCTRAAYRVRKFILRHFLFNAVKLQVCSCHVLSPFRQFICCLQLFYTCLLQFAAFTAQFYLMKVAQKNHESKITVSMNTAYSRNAVYGSRLFCFFFMLLPLSAFAADHAPAVVFVVENTLAFPCAVEALSFRCLPINLFHIAFPFCPCSR